MTVPNPYFEVYPVLQHDGDMYHRMKPSALLRYTQQIATTHAAKLGLDSAFYRDNHLAFLLAKQALEFTRIPEVDEVLTYTTYPEQSRRASYKRVTIVTDEQGREVACVDSRWILVDTDTRRIVRRPPAVMEGLWLPEVERTLDQIVPKAETLRDGGVRRADYSMCYTNGQMNNTNYIDLACDLIDPQRLKAGGVRRVTVCYHREIPYGEMVALQIGNVQNGVYVCGTRDGLPAFEAYCGF